MPPEERALLVPAIWEGCRHDLPTSIRFLFICELESGLRCRRWFPEVKQNMDLAGAHNDVLCLELWREGLITDSKFWRDSEQWKAWRVLFQKRPDIGTMIAARAFTRIVYKNKLDDATEIWRIGVEDNVNGILYLMKIDCLTEDMLRETGRRETSRKNK